MRFVEDLINIVTILAAALAAAGILVMMRQLAVARSSNGGALIFEADHAPIEDTVTVGVSAVGPGSWHNLRCELYGDDTYTPVDSLPVARLLCTDTKQTWAFRVIGVEASKLWFIVFWDEPFLGNMRSSAICGKVETTTDSETALWGWNWKRAQKLRGWILKWPLADRCAPERFLGKWKAKPRKGNAAGRGPRAQLDSMRGVEHPIKRGAR
ncbi:hypothetical protein R4P64_07805 [Rhodococcus sp. IEGM 1366]|uniref:hypothetical protein n=1 Tax=Rhodococcus sp. IEGM 1366 TaxID=3082223 RepID=UPI002953626E|nr:hypothetical protein [Rhodococcus sp. IEGM 1366]MDV8066405.1 hypothetical protein [Rhodococcus sp. IEGM 1366]